MNVENEQTRDFLIQERFGIHQLLDECIKRKKIVGIFFKILEKSIQG